MAASILSIFIVCVCLSFTKAAPNYEPLNALANSKSLDTQQNCLNIGIPFLGEINVCPVTSTECGRVRVAINSFFGSVNVNVGVCERASGEFDNYTPYTAIVEC